MLSARACALSLNKRRLVCQRWLKTACLPTGGTAASGEEDGGGTNNNSSQAEATKTAASRLREEGQRLRQESRRMALAGDIPTARLRHQLAIARETEAEKLLVSLHRAERPSESASSASSLSSSSGSKDGAQLATEAVRRANALRAALQRPFDLEAARQSKVGLLVVSLFACVLWCVRRLLDASWRTVPVLARK